MNIASIKEKMRDGFHPTFWVANGMELFERLAYYGQATVLSIFLRNTLHFSEVEAGQLSSIFGGLIYALPIVGGALADKFGFRKAFSVAFSMLAIGYFLIGSTAMEGFRDVYTDFGLYPSLVIILIFTAIGGSFIKPSVLGTVAVTTAHESRSLGYAIYYWLVNIGGAVGPAIAFLVRDKIGIAGVYVVSAISCALMLVVNLTAYKEVKNGQERSQDSLLTVFKNLVRVLTNFKFIIFLLIFGLYWIMFWQIFIIIPFYVTDFIDVNAPFELIQSAGAWGIILLQLIVNRLTKKWSPGMAMILGFLVSTLSWLIVLANPSIPTIVAAIFTFSIGEQMQAPRYYEYISDIAPPGQQGLFQGYAFIPVAIAWGVGGALGGWMYGTIAKPSAYPEIIFVFLFGIGVIATLSMLLYHLLVTRHQGH